MSGQGVKQAWGEGRAVKFAAFILLLSFPAPQSGCQSAQAEEELVVPSFSQGFRGIVGGSPTSYKSWQGVVSILSEVPGGAVICSGTLIDPELVLTAGHCVYLPEKGIDLRANLGSTTVVGGANIFLDPIRYSNIEEIVVHPGWPGRYTRSSEQIDLAMIRLETPITDVPFFAVRDDSRPVEKEKGKIVGYGLSDSTVLSSSGVHSVGDTTLLAVYLNVIELGDPAGTCQGDSGGPLFTMVSNAWQLTGVTSFGASETCSPSGGSYSVNTFTYLDWIDETVLALTGHERRDPAGDGADSDSSADKDSDTERDCPTNSGWPCSCDKTNCENGDRCVVLKGMGDGKTGYCSRACGGDQDCGASFGALGDCLSFGDGNEGCVMVCSFADDCPKEQECQAVSGADFRVCFPGSGDVSAGGNAGTDASKREFPPYQRPEDDGDCGCRLVRHEQKTSKPGVLLETVFQWIVFSP